MLKIKKNISLSKQSTFRIGGPAKFFVEVGDEKELHEALDYAEKNKLKFFILGGGSNVLFSDEGFDGIIIKMVAKKTKAKTINIKNENEIECWAGVNLNELISFSKNNNLTGLENLVGIPGSVGGAVRGNAGAFGTVIGDLVKEVKTIEKKISKKNCGFFYRTSIFKENSNLIIVSVVLKLKKGKKKEIEKKILETMKKRNESQPKGWKGSAGSFFKNPVVKNKNLIKLFEKETGKKMIGNQLPAGWLIAEAGLLGKKIGGAEISEKHGNFLINTGKATAENVIMLASIVKQKVRDEFEVQLQEEVHYVS
jgi:UDP-N-acetylmuramate dehydrogenase